MGGYVNNTRYTDETNLSRSHQSVSQEDSALYET